MFNIWHLYVPCQFLHHHENPVFYLTNDLFIYLFIYLFIWITNGLIVLKVIKCLTKVTVTLYLSIQLIYFSEEDNSICMFKGGWECISLFQFLSWSTAKVGIIKKKRVIKTEIFSSGFSLSVLVLCFLSISLKVAFFPFTLKVLYRTLYRYLWLDVNLWG